MNDPTSEVYKHIFERLTEVEEQIRDLREVAWPVCQGLLDKEGPYTNKEKKSWFFKFLDREEVLRLIRLKERFMGRTPGLAVSELEWVLVETPREV
jgi:hypothetical protein